MYCDNKNYVLDAFFAEAGEKTDERIVEHIAGCEHCRAYLAELRNTVSALDKVGLEEPSAYLIEDVISSVAGSSGKPVQQKSKDYIVPVLQIAFGQIFLFAVIYFLKIQITLSPLWKTIQKNWIIQSIGSIGLAAAIVLVAGAFITLSLAPILLFESKEKNVLVNK